MTSASNRPARSPPGREWTEAEIGNVHENDLEDRSAGRRFELGLCRLRPLCVPAGQVDAGDLGTQCQLPGHLLADPGYGARY